MAPCVARYIKFRAQHNMHAGCSKAWSQRNQQFQLPTARAIVLLALLEALEPEVRTSANRAALYGASLGVSCICITFLPLSDCPDHLQLLQCTKVAHKV